MPRHCIAAHFMGQVVELGVQLQRVEGEARRERRQKRHLAQTLHAYLQAWQRGKDAARRGEARVGRGMKDGIQEGGKEVLMDGWMGQTSEGRKEYVNDRRNRYE